MAQTRSPFGRETLKFLEELEVHNDRRWFEKNKRRYEDEVREPGLEFIRRMAPHVERFSPHLRASDRKVGGSMMRIYRDVRFSKDKRPYKTNLGIQFRHEAGKDVHAPGLYFHIQPGNIFIGAGMWHPDGEALAGIRERIDNDPRGWKRVRDGKRFREHWEFRGESLKRPPRGYDSAHPLIDDIKRKDYIAVHNLRRRDVVSAECIELVADRFFGTRGFMVWLASAVGLPL